MKKFNLKSFTKGWFIGNFKPAIFNTADFEIAIKKYQKGNKENSHYHKVAKEYTAIISGLFKFNDKILKEGDIMMIEPNESVKFACLKDGVNVVIKIPSIKNDKFLLIK